MITRRYMRPIAVAVSLGTVLGALVGCSGTPTKGTAAKPVTISFWDDNGGPQRTPVYKKLITQFEAANPSITVDYVGIPAADAQQKYETAVAGGSVPDVAIVSGVMLSSLVAQKALVPLDKRLSASSLKGHIAADTVKSAKDIAPDSKLYILPMTSTPDVIWYRSDWFKKAGLNPPDTWADFYTAAKALTKPSSGQYGFAIRGGAGGTSQLVATLLSCSGLNSIFDKNGKARLDEPAVVACATKFASLYGVDTSKADLNLTYQDMVNAFDTGKAAMIRHNLGSANDHLTALGKGVAVAAPMPTQANGHRTLEATQPEGPAIFAGGNHSDAAWKFSEFLLSHKSNSYWNEQAGQIPSNTEARADSWVTDDAQMSNITKTLSDPKSTVVSAPIYLPGWGGILTDMTPLWQSVLLGKTTPKAFLTSWSNELTTAEAAYRKQFGK